MLPTTNDRRSPNRSTSGPASACAITYGAISANATRPVLLAEPVLVSTIHGMASWDIEVPSIEMKYEDIRAAYGARRRGLGAVMTPHRHPGGRTSPAASGTSGSRGARPARSADVLGCADSGRRAR